MWQVQLFDPQILAQNVINGADSFPFNGADSFPLLAAPLFILAGEVMNLGGLSKRIVNDGSSALRALAYLMKPHAPVQIGQVGH